MAKCVIIDDEVQAIAIIEEFIKEIPELELVKSSTSTVEMVSFLKNNPVDIIFLDVNIPKLNGIDFIKVIVNRPEKPYIILTTAYEKYALLGYEFDVADYLLKPFAFNRFIKAVDKVLGLIKQKQVPIEVDEKDSFFVKVDNKNKAINILYDDILYVEGLKNYISIYTVEKRIITLMNMRNLESQLPSKRFLRVHRSYIIPTKRIKSVDGNQIFLQGGEGSIPLGVTYRTKMSEFLDNNSFR